MILPGPSRFLLSCPTYCTAGRRACSRKRGGTPGAGFAAGFESSCLVAVPLYAMQMHQSTCAVLPKVGWTRGITLYAFLISDRFAAGSETIRCQCSCIRMEVFQTNASTRMLPVVAVWLYCSYWWRLSDFEHQQQELMSSVFALACNRRAVPCIMSNAFLRWAGSIKVKSVFFAWLTRSFSRTVCLFGPYKIILTPTMPAIS